MRQRQCRARRETQDEARPPAAANQFGNGPDDGQARSHQGEIGITVGPGLKTDLNQADHGQEHDQVPKPADEQIWTACTLGDHCPGNGDQEHKRSQQSGEAHVSLGIRIEHGEPLRPEKLAQVGGVAHHGILHPHRQGNAVGRDQVLRDDDRHRARHERKDQQRDLLHDRVPGPDPWGRRRIALARLKRPSGQ